MNTTHILGPVAMLIGAVLALTACSAEEVTPEPDTGTTTGTSPTPTTGATADAEIEPTTVTLYTSEPQEKIDAVIAAFNQDHPEITVEVYRAGTGDLTARIESERVAAGIQADLLLAADVPTFEAYKADDLLARYAPPDADAFLPGMIDPDGYYVGTRIIPTVIAYNTDQIDSPPTSWQELTEPEYSERITMPNPDVSGAAAFNAAVWLDDDGLGEDWLTALAANRPVIAESNGPVAQAVASGTQPIGIVVDYLVRELRAAGSPIDVSYPSEGVPFVSQPIGIFADSDDQEAAALFADFVVSQRGQELAVSQAYLPVRADAGTPEGAPALEDIAFLEPDLDVITALRPEAVALFNELFS